MKRTRSFAVIAVTFFLHACVTTNVAPPPPTTPLSGMASWYGQEFAGRTTANGEIFDPMLLTAAHRTLPFGTVLEVKNPKNGRTVQVRVNDRGPFVGDRLIDLSYAAAEKIGLVDQGIAPVDLAVVRLGRGDREPPRPYVVTTDAPPASIPIIAKPVVVPAVPKKTTTATPPPVPFPLPPSATPVASSDISSTKTDDHGFTVDVAEEHGGVPTRKQVSASGTSIEQVDAEGKVVPTPKPAPPKTVEAPLPAPVPTPAKKMTIPVSASGRYVLQLGAFQIEKNADDFRKKIESSGATVFIEHNAELYRVRVGPFATRTAAIEAKEKLDGAGFSAIVLNLE
ncbi:MAG TPA: septal ring lytic transglycosylase RlpA family protein [Thermoanaerobaculia bacterium]|nr:septal ring lytic transglycosylase RlpA family protein [Thermoanaerobaculia bacterium]